MFLTGIADEAGKDIDTQIRAHQELGWSHIELRNVPSGQFTDVSDAEFDEICGKLDAANIKVSCFASALANWARKITNPLEADLKDLERSIPRMKKLGTQFIRVMSWPNDGLDTDAWRDEAVKRMKTLAKLAEDGGVILALENCSGWASESAEHYARFFELVDSSALKAVYDTGNPAGHGHTNTWTWYEKAKPHIAYVHIKSHTGPNPKNGEPRMTFPDDPESDSKIPETLADLVKSGYDGGVSIEPHLKAVVHEGKEISDAEAAYQTYVEYGKRLARMVEGAKAGVGG